MTHSEKIRYFSYDHVFGFIPAEERNRAQYMYFVGHAFGRPFVQDLRRTVRQAFEPDLVPYFADREMTRGHLLQKIARKIYITRFGVFDLSNYSPNVYLELGIALGVNKRIIAIAHENAAAPLPSWLDGLSVLRYPSYRELTEQLRSLAGEVERSIDEPTSARDYPCYFCGKLCPGRSSRPRSRYCLVLDCSTTQRRDRDFRGMVERGLEETGLRPRYIDRPTRTQWQICQIAKDVSRAEFSICRIGPDTDPLVFFGFGASIGFRKPPVLLVQGGIEPTGIAANLRGWDYYSYQDYGDAEEYMRGQTDRLLEEIRSAEIPTRYLEFGQYKVQILKDISDLLQRDMTFEDRLEGVLILALYAMRVDAGSLMLISKDGARLEIKALVSPQITLTETQKWRAFALGEGIAGWVAKHNKPYRAANVHQAPHYKPSTFSSSLVSLISVPITYEGQVIGVLNGDSDREDHFREDDEIFLMAVSHLIAPTIHHEYTLRSASGISSDEAHTTIQRHLFRDPICLNCGHEIRLRFIRVRDQDGLRYRLMTVCDHCEIEELVRTYTLSYA